MLWLLLIGVAAALMFVIFYKRPVNHVTVVQPPQAFEPPVQSQQVQPMDFNDLFKPRPPQPPSDQPGA